MRRRVHFGDLVSIPANEVFGLVERIEKPGKTWWKLYRWDRSPPEGVTCVVLHENNPRNPTAGLWILFGPHGQYIRCADGTFEIIAR